MPPQQSSDAPAIAAAGDIDLNPRRMLSPEEFAGIWRKAYPELSKDTQDDRILTHAILSVYPEFNKDVVDVLGGVEMAQGLPTAPREFRPPPPPMPSKLGSEFPTEGIAGVEYAANRGLHRAAESMIANPPSGLPGTEMFPEPWPAAVPPGFVGPQQPSYDVAPTGFTPTPGQTRTVETAMLPISGFVSGPLAMAESAPGVLRGLGQGASAIEGRGLRPADNPAAMSEPEIAHAVAKFLNGTMETGTFMIPEALAKQPLKVGVGLFFGIGTAHRLNLLGQSQGWDPGNTELVSTLGGLSAGLLAAKATDIPGWYQERAEIRAEAVAEAARREQEAAALREQQAARAAYQQAYPPLARTELPPVGGTTSGPGTRRFVGTPPTTPGTRQVEPTGEGPSVPIAQVDPIRAQAEFQHAADVLARSMRDYFRQTRDLYARAWLNRVKDNPALAGQQTSPFTALDAANNNLMLQELDKFSQLSDAALTRMANFPTPYSERPGPPQLGGLPTAGRPGPPRQFGSGPRQPIPVAPPGAALPPTPLRDYTTRAGAPPPGPIATSSPTEVPTTLDDLVTHLTSSLENRRPTFTTPVKPAFPDQLIRDAVRLSPKALADVENRLRSGGGAGRSTTDPDPLTLLSADEHDALDNLIAQARAGGFTGDNAAALHLKRELARRLQVMQELDAEYQQSGRNPIYLLKQIAREGGISIQNEIDALRKRGAGGTTGYKGELDWLREAMQGRTLRGVYGVIWKGSTRGLSVDGMVEALRQYPEFAHVRDNNHLLDLLRDAVTAPADPSILEKFVKGLTWNGDKWWEWMGKRAGDFPEEEIPPELMEAIPPEKGAGGPLEPGSQGELPGPGPEGGVRGPTEPTPPPPPYGLTPPPRGVPPTPTTPLPFGEGGPGAPGGGEAGMVRLDLLVPFADKLDRWAQEWHAGAGRRAEARQRVLEEIDRAIDKLVVTGKLREEDAPKVQETLQEVLETRRTPPGLQLGQRTPPTEPATVSQLVPRPETPELGALTNEQLNAESDRLIDQRALNGRKETGGRAARQRLLALIRERDRRMRAGTYEPPPLIRETQPAGAERELSDQERSHLEWRQNADRVAANPQGASETDLRRAIGYLSHKRAALIRDAQKQGKTVSIDVLRGFDSEMEWYARLANEKRTGREEQPALPGAESVRSTETPTPEFEAPFSLTPPEAGPGAGGKGKQGSLFGEPPPAPLEPTTKPRSPLRTLFEDEEGRVGSGRISLVSLRDGPTAAKMTRWLDRNRDAYGGTDWFKEVQSAVDRGDPRTAFRTVLMVETLMNQERVSTPKVIPGERVRQPGGAFGPSKPATILEPNTPGYKVAKKDLEGILGVPLPKDVGVDTAGNVVVGDLHGRLKMPATDMLLAGSIVRELENATDPTKVILIPGNTDTRLRLFRQMADQIARDMPDEIVQPLLELTGIKDPIELAKHFTRRASDAGRLLQSLSAWRDANWESVVKLTREGFGDTPDEGEVEGLSGQTPNGFLKWLYTEATPEDLKKIGFRPPPTIKLKTKEGDAWAKRWFRSNMDRQAATKAQQETLDNLTKEMGWLNTDRLILQGSLDASRGGRKRDAIDVTEDTSRAFAISQLSTANRNFDTQGVAYNTQILDDLIGAAASGLMGGVKKVVGLESRAQNFADAGRLLAHAREMAQAELPGFLGGTSGRVGVRSMLRHPLTDTMQVVYDLHREQLKGMSPKDVRKVLAVVDEFPRHAAALLGSTSYEEGSVSAPAAPGQGGTAGGVTGEPQTKLERYTAFSHKVRNFVTTPTRIQEAMYRGMLANASFRAQLREKGLDPTAVLAGDETGDPYPGLVERFGQQEVERMAGIAVSSALNGTFAAKPYPGSVPDALMRIFSAEGIGPLLRTTYPFPRFNLVNAPRWFYDHSLAGLFDGPLYAFNLLGRAAGVPGSAPFKGRLYRGIEAGLIHDEIPKITQQISGAEYDLAIATQQYTAAKLAAKQAGIAYRKLEARAEKTDTIPGDIRDEMLRVGEEMHAQVEAADNALADHRDAGRRLKAFKQQQTLYEQKEMAATEAGMPKSFGEYWGRQASGLALLGAALVMRASEGAKDTKFYEYRIKGHTYDLRAYSPVPVPFLLPADVLIDTYRNTDWDQFHQIRNDYFTNHPDADRWNPYNQAVAAEQALEQAYHGKYTGESLRNEAAAAFFSMSRATGITSALIDYLTGQTGSSGTVGHEGIQQRAASAVFTTIGQFLGRFTVPAQIAKDIIGQFSPEEAKARIPQESTPEHPNLPQLLYEPALAHIPGASRYVPEKVSPFTGQPITGVNTGLRQLAGLTERDRNRFEDELNRTGTSYGTLAPRQIGDRNFDNAVAEHYAEILRTTIKPQLLDNARYANPKTDPDVKRELISKYIGGAKLKAYIEAGKDWNLDARETKGLTSPAQAERRQLLKRWIGMLQKQTLEDHPELKTGQGQEPEPEPEPQTFGTPPPQALNQFNRSQYGPPPAAL
jgi:hypothetical protein